MCFLRVNLAFIYIVSVQVRKQQLELDMEWQTGSKSGKEYVKTVYCHPAYLTYMQSESEVKSLSRVQLFATPWTVARQAPLSMGFSRQEYWSGLPFPSPGESSWPRDWTQVSRIVGRRFTVWATRTWIMFFWNYLAFSIIQWMFAIWSLAPLPFLNPACTSRSSQFTYC